MCINYTGDDAEIIKSLAIAENIGADYLQVRPALPINGKKLLSKLPDIKHDKNLKTILEITEYKFLGANEERNYTECEAYHFNPFIWQTGQVDVCGYHKGEMAKPYNLGNLYDVGLKGRFANIMERAPKSVPVADNCLTCCKLNSMNSTIKHMRDLEDIDFP